MGEIFIVVGRVRSFFMCFRVFTILVYIGFRSIEYFYVIFLSVNCFFLGYIVFGVF